MKRIGYLLAVFFFLVALSACSSEPRGTTVHKPGIYKGEKDPLLALKNQQELSDRVRLVQTDR